MTEGAARPPVLVVETDPLVRAALTTLLERSGYRPLAAASAAAAEALLSEQPHLAILDLNLPRRGAIRLARRLRRAIPRIRIVLVASSEEHRSAQRAVAAGEADLYIVKPLTSAALRRACNELGGPGAGGETDGPRTGGGGASSPRRSP